MESAAVAADSVSKGLDTSSETEELAALSCPSWNLVHLFLCQVRGDGLLSVVAALLFEKPDHQLGVAPHYGL